MMSAEVPFELARELDAFPTPRFLTPAEMIANEQSSRRVFDLFMREYGGQPQQYKDAEKTVRIKGEPVTVPVAHGVFSLDRLGYQYPEVVRLRHGVGEVSYPGVQVSGYTDLGKLIHLRFNVGYQQPEHQYLVAVGDIVTGELYEPAVIDAKHVKDRTGRLETTLYLEGGAEWWPQEYWPQLKMTHDHVTFYPGGDRRIESVHGIHELYMKTHTVGRAALYGSALHAVQ